MRDIIDAVEDGDISAVTSLLDDDPNLVEFSPFGESPLHIAAEQGATDIVRLLIDRKADVNRLGNNRQTPLHLAAGRGRIQAAKLLVHHGAKLDLTNDYGYTPLLAASKRGEVEAAELLLSFGANCDLASAVALGQLNKVQEVLSDNPDAVRDNRFRSSLLSDAVYSQDSEIVKLLLAEPEIDPNEIGDSGEPPLVAAVSRSNFNLDIVRLLVQNEADQNQRSSSGDTAYDRATLVGLNDVDDLFKV